MERIAFLVKQRALFFGSFIALMIAGTLFLLIAGKAGSFFFFNKHHFSCPDSIMEYYTNVGNGLFVICLALICFFIYKQRQLGLTLLYSFLSSGIMVQLVKNIHNSHRPQLFFTESPGGYAAYQQYFIKGIDFAYNNSFPSGHTATAFAAATVCALMLNKKWQGAVLLAAILVGFSRIYLGQHFLLDVLVGALIGVTCGIGCVYLANKYSDKAAFGTFKSKA
jgi:membrane-associated phospholipid phosphatase